jgi:hypothetical protein
MNAKILTSSDGLTQELAVSPSWSPRQSFS